MSCTKEPYVGQDKLQSCRFLMHVKHLYFTSALCFMHALNFAFNDKPPCLSCAQDRHSDLLGLAAGWVFTLLSLVENIVTGLPIDFKHLHVAKLSSHTVHTNRLNKQVPYISIYHSISYIYLLYTISHSI